MNRAVFCLIVGMVGCGGSVTKEGSGGHGGAGGMGGSVPAPDAGHDATVDVATGPCPAESPTVVCPDGAYTVCDNGGFTLPCCDHGTGIDACATPSGILTHQCPADCASGLCTKAASDTDASAEVITCCSLDFGNDPCQHAVGD